MERFTNRREAGHALARHLRAFANDSDAVVLALPRGGVPVAYEIARELDLPLDVFIVRKLGVPRYEELAMGAIASGGARVLNDEVVHRLGISEEEIDAVAAREQLELERREREYRGDTSPLDVTGKTAILVDDGLATGSTMRAAIQALRQKKCRTNYRRRSSWRSRFLRTNRQGSRPGSLRDSTGGFPGRWRLVRRFFPNDRC